MGSKMGNIARSIKEMQDPTEGIQSYIQTQLCALRADMLKYEEASEDCRKAQQSRENLHHQLEMLKEKHVKLEESLRGSREEETDVKARYSLLLSELETWKRKACNHDADPTQLERERENLRNEAEKAKGDLRKALTELGRAQQQLEDQAKELTTTKVRQPTEGEDGT